MPRIRTIKPKFWDDTKLSKVSRDARLLYIGMWNFCDDLGVLIGEPVWIKSKIFPYDKLDQDEFNVFLNELILGKFVMLIKKDNEDYIYVPKFNRHQRINKPNKDDIYIDNESLMEIIDQSRINHGLITNQSGSNHVSIRGGKDSIGKDSIGKDAVSVIDVISEEMEEKLLCPKMTNILKKHIPIYTSDTDRDYPPLFSIAKFILKMNGLSGDAVSNSDSICREWEMICVWLKEDQFYSQKSLKTISTHIQEISTKAKYGSSKTEKELSEYEKKLLSDREKYKGKKSYQ